METSMTVRYVVTFEFALRPPLDHDEFETYRF